MLCHISNHAILFTLHMFKKRLIILKVFISSRISTVNVSENQWLVIACLLLHVCIIHIWKIYVYIFYCSCNCWEIKAKPDSDMAMTLHCWVVKAKQNNVVVMPHSSIVIGKWGLS